LSPATEPSASLGRMRILLVEDDTVLREVIAVVVGFAASYDPPNELSPGLLHLFESLIEAPLAMLV